MFFLKKITHNEIIQLLNKNSLLQGMHVYLYSKDQKGHFLSVNECLAKDAGFTKEADMIGLTDYDISWKKFAPTLRKNDMEVISSRNPRFKVETIQIYNGKKLDLFTCKFPLQLNSKKIFGNAGVSFLLDNEELITKLNNFSASNQLNYSQPLKEDAHFTKREIDCLFYLVKGMTTKEIAKTLIISPRTVEHHLNNIKGKLNCSSRSSLISKAFTLRVIQENLMLI